MQPQSPRYFGTLLEKDEPEQWLLRRGSEEGPDVALFISNGKIRPMATARRTKGQLDLWQWPLQRFPNCTSKTVALPPM